VIRDAVWRRAVHNVIMTGISGDIGGYGLGIGGIEKLCG